MRKTLSLLALALSSCKLGPFPDEPVERPEAPLPSGWIGHNTDAGVSDAEAPVQRDK